MYSGETIELEELWDNQKYDIDHIFPQSKVMDDSLDNRVLVKKKCNQMKEDKYPIDETVRKKMQPFWKSLVDAGLISGSKYSAAGDPGYTDCLCKSANRFKVP